MVRVMMVVEDYNEMIYLQTILKKIGFDVEGLNNAKKYQDASLGFNPQILIASAGGKKVDILSFGKDIRKNRGLPKIIALRLRANEITKHEMEEAGVDMVLETPVNIKKLVLGLTSLAGIDEAGFLDKLAKIQARPEELENESVMVLGSLDNLEDDLAERQARKQMQDLLGLPEKEPGGSPPPPEVTAEPGIATAPHIQLTPQEAEARQKRFHEFLNKMEKPKPGNFVRDRILQFNKMIRTAPKPDNLDEVELDRKSFVKALFNKKPKSKD